MNTGSKVALAAILIVGLGVGGYFLYEKLQPEIGGGDKTPDTKGGGVKPKPTDLTKGGEIGKEIGKDSNKDKSEPAPEEKNVGAQSSVTSKTVLARGSGANILASHKPYVIKLQNGLNALGVKPALEADGIFGAKTEAALVAKKGKKSITVGEVEKAYAAANFGDNGQKAFIRGKHFAGVRIR